MYSIEFSQEAEKQLSKLGVDIQERIISVLERIRIRPFSFVKKLVGSPYYRLRVGDYRVILDIVKNENIFAMQKKKTFSSIREERLIIFVIELGHRKNIYKD